MRKPRKQKPEVKHDVNLVNLIQDFGSEDKCRAYLEEVRWPDGPHCPRCQSKSVSQVEDRNQYDCNACRYQFSVTSGTVMHDTHLPLWKWFLAAYLMIESKKGMSANQIKRTIEVSYKTAWYLCHRIRAAMATAEACTEPLQGVLEADETFVGGKAYGMGHGYTGNKATVAGVAERGGRIRLNVIPDRTREALHAFLDQHTDKDAIDALYTDELKSYGGFIDSHETVIHSLMEWVRGNVHTNSIENVWSLLKRAIIGAYHKVSHKHLDRYLDELEFRFGGRNNPRLFRDTIAQLVTAQAMPYETLIGD
jgi:transposase-like protein